MSDTGTTAAAATTTAATTTAATTSWFNGVQGEDLGHLQNRGWDKLDAPAAALAAAKAHREAEKLIGVPADQVLRAPKDKNDAAAWTAINAKFGVPADAKEYDFSTVKFADGDPVDEKFAAALKPVLQAAHVSKEDAPAIVKAVVAHMEQSEAGDVKAKADALATERDTLRINWGSNTEANLIIAKNAAAALNVSEEAVQALENQIGYAKVMEMFRNIGQRIGEDTFITTRGIGDNKGVMTMEQAEATIAEKTNDGDFVRRLNNGDAQAIAEFNNLTRMVAAGRARR